MAARIKPSGQSQRERDAISLGRIEALLDVAGGGAIECPSCQKKHKIKPLDSNVLAAIKIRYDKLRPSLSAVEQTTISEDEKLDDNQILAKLSALIEQHPDIVQQALALKARQSTAPLPDTTIKPDIKAA
jgi:hypothetical protein